MADRFTKLEPTSYEQHSHCCDICDRSEIWGIIEDPQKYPDLLVMYKEKETGLIYCEDCKSKEA